jgi:hypothetical protein
VLSVFTENGKRIVLVFVLFVFFSFGLLMVLESITSGPGSTEAQPPVQTQQNQTSPSYTQTDDSVRDSLVDLCVETRMVEARKEATSPFSVSEATIRWECKREYGTGIFQ